MTTTQKITRIANAHGLTVDTKPSQLVVRDQHGNAVAGATFGNGRFAGGYTTDHMGHVTSHDTVADMLRFLAA